MRFSVAPMMDWTDRHERFFLRQISRHVRMYTEMITANAVRFGDRDRLLAFHPQEHPVALQLGGADPDALAAAAEIGAELGYDEINLNVGCPSDRVQSGRFGACLMREPPLVAACVAAIARATDVVVTVKHRIGVDDQPDWPALRGFVATVADAGCRHFIVHARKAWLRGLSPKDNRDVPPLRYELVYRLKDTFPDLHITINGGVDGLDAAAAHLCHVDGVMIGRSAYQNPFILAALDRRFFDRDSIVPSRADILDCMESYIEEELAGGTPLKAITRHMLGLFNGQPGARAWRRHLAENATSREAGIEVVRQAAALIGPATTRRAA